MPPVKIHGKIGTAPSVPPLERVESDLRRTPGRARVRVIDEIAEISASGRWREQRRGVVGDIALDVPGAAYRVRGASRFGGGAEVDVDAADPEIGGAVELPAGLDRPVGLEHHFLPRTGTRPGGRG